VAIKTQVTDNVHRVITKVIDEERRVSCSCCSGQDGCCMYPATLFGSAYGAADLPDSVTVNWSGRYNGTLNKSGSSYVGGGVTLQIVNNVWKLSDSNGTRTVGNCLFAEFNSPLVTDQFEDSYRFIQNYDPFEQNIILVRKSLCYWEGTGDFDVCNYYLAYGTGSNDGSGIPPIWSVSATGFGGFCGEGAIVGKSSGSGNTPVGQYVDPGDANLDVEIEPL
jgi:hypothetical protein